MIERTISDYLRRLGRQFPVVAITGPRQSGKTTLAKAVFRDFSYVNLEDPNLRREAMADGATFLLNHPAPLIVDEAQRVPELLSHVQVAVDAEGARSVRYVLTGSHQPKLREGLSQSLAGRVGIARLLPLSLRELSSAGRFGERDETAFRGFMPRLHDGPEADPADFWPNYVATYLERDVSQILRLKDRNRFETFLALAAGRVGQLLNYDSIASDVGVSAVTVKDWISVLEASFVAFTLPCFYRNYGKRFVKAPKLYFCDTGLVCSLLGIRSPEQLARDPLVGNVFENMVVADAFKERFNAGRQPDLYFIRDRKGTEVDLAVLDGRALDLWEIKSARTFSPDFAAALKTVRAYIPETRRCGVVYAGTRFVGGDVDFVPYGEFGRHLAGTSGSLSLF